MLAHHGRPLCSVLVPFTINEASHGRHSLTPLARLDLLLDPFILYHDALYRERSCCCPVALFRGRGRKMQAPASLSHDVGL